MGTRAVALVYGNETHIRPGHYESTRLYSHGGGDPTDMLPVLTNATRMAGAMIERGRDWLTPIPCNGRPASLDQMPSQSFAQYVVAASLGWYGPGVVPDDDPDGSIARYQHIGMRVEDAGWGNQSDLEWLYLVDLPARRVTVWGGDYGDPAEHLDRGPADPVVVCDGFLPDHQGVNYLRILTAVRELGKAGWTLTPPAATGTKRPTTIRTCTACNRRVNARDVEYRHCPGCGNKTFFVRCTRTAVEKARQRAADLTAKALAWLDAAITGDHRTSTVLSLLDAARAGKSVANLPILADALEDAGLTDPHLLNLCRGTAA